MSWASAIHDVTYRLRERGFSPEVAEDATQSAAERILVRGITPIDLRSYLWTAAWHEAVNAVKHEDVQRRTLSTWLWDQRAPGETLLTHLKRLPCGHDVGQRARQLNGQGQRRVERCRECDRDRKRLQRAA